MNRVTKVFSHLRKEKKCGLVAYITCGDPDLDTTVAVALALEKAGAVCIELGMPFSDPIADGPVIQAASFRALEKGTTTEAMFRVATEIRAKSEIPLVCFSYFNPILKFGLERFASHCAKAGIDSVLITDLPPESAADSFGYFKATGVRMIFLATPTTPDARIGRIDRMSSGFVYYVSTTGVTGTRRELDPGLIERVDQLRSKIRNPLAIGFGVSEHEHYQQLASHCDAVVVGSAIVRAVADGDAAGAPERGAAVVRRILGR